MVDKLMPIMLLGHSLWLLTSWVGVAYSEGWWKFFYIYTTWPGRWNRGLVQERRNSIANALELRLSCTNRLKCFIEFMNSFKGLYMCIICLHIYQKMYSKALTHWCLVTGSCQSCSLVTHHDCWPCEWVWHTLRVAWMAKVVLHLYYMTRKMSCLMDFMNSFKGLYMCLICLHLHQKMYSKHWRLVTHIYIWRHIYTSVNCES